MECMIEYSGDSYVFYFIEFAIVGENSAMLKLLLGLMPDLMGVRPIPLLS